MSSPPLLTIGAFARAVELAPSTLRYYDEAGLLPPAEIDTRTGYRYYTPELERRAALIRRMRDIGIPVEEMRTVLEGPRERAVEILHEFADRAARNARQTHAAVDEILAVLEGADAKPDIAVTVDGPALGAAVRRISRAASEHEVPLRGVLLDLADDRISVVATDRYWLACWDVPVAEARSPGRRAFLPLSGLDALAGRLDRHDVVTLGFGATRLTLADETETVPVETADDRFPAYRLILPPSDGHTGRVTFDRAALTALLPPAAEAEHPIRCVVGRERLAVTRFGDSECTRLDAITSGRPGTLWFSAGLLCKALDTMVGATVSLRYSSPERAVQLVAVEQDRLRALLMPGREQS